MFNADAIKEIASMTSGEITNIGEQMFHVNHKGATLIPQPLPDVLQCFSLTQVINALPSLLSQIKPSERVMLNVLDYNKIQVISEGINQDGKKGIFIEADISDAFRQFRFEHKMSQEEFIIEVMTKFEDNFNRSELLRLVSSIKDEKTKTSDDDGYSQVATVKAGVALTSTTKVKNLWKLVTFKTFPEVEQPEIPYIFRLGQGRGDEVTFALYDCDGGRWKVDLTIAVREWLINQLKVKLADKLERVIIL